MFLDIRHRRCPQFLGFFFYFAKKSNIVLLVQTKGLMKQRIRLVETCSGDAMN